MKPIVVAALAATLLSGCGRAGDEAAAPTGGAPATAAPQAPAKAMMAAPVVEPAAPPPAETPPPPRAAVAAAPARARPLSVAEIIERSPSLSARDRALVGLFENAASRDPSGAVRREHAEALAQRQRCADAACVTRWFNAREASLSQWQ